MPLMYQRAISVALFSAVLSPLCAFQARAGASLFVDDAAVTAPGHCQVEAWVRGVHHGQEYTAVPACTIADTELSLGYSVNADAETTQLWAPGVKKVLRDLETHPWGLAVSAGATWSGATNRWTDWSINVPVSVALSTHRSVLLHVNVGWAEQAGQSGGLTAGTGLEVALQPAWDLLAEIYEDQRGPTTIQLGLRRSVGQAASVDVLVGADRGQNNHWLTVGFNVPF